MPRARSTPPQAKAAKPTPKTKPIAATLAPVLFLPTLLPDPFGESSPELCWGWERPRGLITLRLTQFGWNATASGTGFDPVHLNADSLDQMREDLLASPMSAFLRKALAPAWVLAYETTALSKPAL